MKTNINVTASSMHDPLPDVDPETGGTSSAASPLPLVPKASRAARHAVEETESSRSRGRWKIVLYALAALACGVIT